MEQGREVEVTKYPLEVASIVRTQTFSVESHLAELLMGTLHLRYLKN